MWIELDSLQKKKKSNNLRNKSQDLDGERKLINLFLFEQAQMSLSCVGTDMIRIGQELHRKVLRNMNFKTKHAESCVLQMP